MCCITDTQVKLIVTWGKCVCESVDLNVFKGKSLQREEMDSDEEWVLDLDG